MENATQNPKMPDTPESGTKIETAYRIDDLMTSGLRILQNPTLYCFSSDPIILAHFAAPKSDSRILDIGSGSGILGLLLVGKYGAAHCVDVELQEEFAVLAQKSIELNGLEPKIEVVHDSVQNYIKSHAGATFDIVVSNPPFTAHGDGEKNTADSRALCRHEIALPLGDLISAASAAVKYGGKFCLIHQVERLAEIISKLTEHRLQPKRLRFVEGRTGKKPALVLIEAKKGGKVGLTVEHNLTLYDSDGKETEELKKIYARRD